MNKKDGPKVGDYVSFTVGTNMVAGGEIFAERPTEYIIQTGNGGRGLEYVAKSRIIKE
jgi:hypothetical protein